MSWNGPTNGDYTNVDFTQPPWVDGNATLTHDEVVYVKGHCETIITNYQPSDEYGNPTPSDAYVVDKYNTIDSWEKPVNVTTYNTIMSYDQTINTQGINETGIIPEPVEETPIEEVPQEETPSEVE